MPYVGIIDWGIDCLSMGMSKFVILNTILNKNMFFEQSDDPDEQFQPIATFVLKTYAILNQPQNAQAIAWQSEGTSFIIRNVTNLTQKVLPKHFRHHKYESFIRQLNMYSFSKVKASEGPCFANPHFQRGREDLLRFIKRKPEKKKKKTTSSELQSDKENTIKLISEESCPLHKKDSIILDEQPIVPMKEEPAKVPEVRKKVHFAEVQDGGEEHLSTMIEPSCKWLTNKEESVWQNIKSFKSFKISMKLLGLEEDEPVAEEGDPSEATKTNNEGLVTLKNLEQN